VRLDQAQLSRAETRCYLASRLNAAEMKTLTSNSESSVAISLCVFVRKEGFIWNDLLASYKSRDTQRT
jgi:hypothetical protein